MGDATRAFFHLRASISARNCAFSLCSFSFSALICRISSSSCTVVSSALLKFVSEGKLKPSSGFGKSEPLINYGENYDTHIHSSLTFTFFSYHLRNYHFLCLCARSIDKED